MATLSGFAEPLGVIIVGMFTVLAEQVISDKKGKKKLICPNFWLFCLVSL